MCGIAGIVGPGAERQQAALDRMLAALEHRGPDEGGRWSGPSALLGIRRLSIVDPVGGHQPVVDAEAGVVVVANGEVYGHDRIRARFPDFPYRSGSDIEVVPALHRAHGDGFLAALPGTFALALWEAGPGRLTLARDRFGERPLYWAHRPDGLLLFASEPQALRASGLVEVEVDRAVVAQQLRQGYVPPGRSIWQGISSLPPASSLRFEVGGQPLLERWWSPPEVVEPAGGVGDPVAWFRTALDRAVQDQLVADVPVGTLLSGGLDSSTVSALAARHHRRIAGFAFDMPGDSEVPYAQAVADRHGIDLHVLRPSPDDLVDLLQDVARTWGEPLGDSSTVPTLLLSRFVRREVTVALTGDGADELLGGYLCWARPFLHPDDPARAAAGGSAPAPSRWWARGSRARRTGGRSVPAGTEVARRYADFRSYFSAAELVGLGLPPASGADVDVSGYGYGTADDISRFDLDHYLPGDILVKTDRASMATGLEVRAPFLDVEVAEGCLRLPARWKVDASHEKLLLREAFGDLLPPQVVARPKQGFGSPMARWLAEPAVADLVRAELTDPGAPLFDLLDRAAVAPYLATPDQRLWNLLTLALWWRHHRPGAGGGTAVGPQP
ncbi:asparagine synthase (glutamine-hydrolyzing) [Aquihabitans sp. G128]|uniref:asparagine synthase (glutamine-hydrolyzing) n=1 Tax=Aquihabitans sp. G128 TaxID=2849779 RepID=UPI001C23D4C9|nr:asparagine synthase (glutamine-hydrolyzing) [Aquihabitans sp. G128]QXC60291.1 asparagine synthase (glutamine-hydrolyzing) [Aquihabitans sp. G128]